MSYQPQTPEELIRDLNRKIERFFKKVENFFSGKSSKNSGGSGSSFSGIALIIGAILILVAAFTSYYTVQPDEQAVVLRLGNYHTTSSPGLHFKLPFGVDQAIKVKTTRVLQEEFGFRTESVRSQRTRYSEKNFDDESLMVTGDLNVAEVEWIVQFQIGDPQKFLFETKDPIQNVRDVSEAVMRRTVGDRLVNEVLTVGRAQIAIEAKEHMQEVLDQYGTGIRIVSVELQDVNPPDKVKPSFNEVNAAKQQQEQDINKAEREYNKVIPEARGKAEQRISQAEGYATALVNRSKGDANKFRQILAAYRKAPKVTRDRLYLEAMEDIMKRFNQLTVVDGELKGLLPVFQKKKD